jgi:xylan 1,4-beta-xylosidase
MPLEVIFPEETPYEVILDRRAFVKSATWAGAFVLAPGAARSIEQSSPSNNSQAVTVHVNHEHGKLPHVWEECVGSDRAAVGMRQQWLSDLEVVKKTTGIKSVRFHGLFDDEMGVWPAGAKQPNFLYVDIVFDAMLALGIKPLVELSFMPAALASGDRTIFFYRGNVTPPKELERWGELIREFGHHCVQRYGIDEVGTWKFEVWNEPNLVYFWTGKQEDYFELYRQSATALTSVDQRLMVGGPSTARASWVGDLLAFCSEKQVPIDFVSTHIYPDDPQKIVFGEDTHYPYEEVISRALSKVRSEIKSSHRPDIPLYITEWSSQNPAFIAHTIKSTVGLAELMSFWTFDNVYEELGIPKTFLNTGFGLLGMRGVPRPSFYTFALLHKLGAIQLETGDGPVLATRRSDGSLAILVWNLIPRPPGQKSATGDPMLQTSGQDQHIGDPLKLVLTFEGSLRHGRASITRVDETSGNFLPAYEAMGSPAYPTVEQIAILKRKSELSTPEIDPLDSRRQLTVVIPPNGVALLELE